MNYPEADPSGYQNKRSWFLCNCVVWLPLILEIFLDYFFIRVLAYRIDLITACPKLTSPELLLNFRMRSEYLFGCYTLYSTHNFSGSIHWNTLYQKMNMVTINPNLQKMNFISFLYPKADFFKCLGYRNTEHIPTILDWANKMIQKQTLVMALMNMLTHIHKSTYLYAKPEAEPRGILMNNREKRQPILGLISFKFEVWSNKSPIGPCLPSILLQKSLRNDSLRPFPHHQQINETVGTLNWQCYRQLLPLAGWQSQLRLSFYCLMVRSPQSFL